MNDVRRMGDEALRPTTRAPDRAWRFPRLPMQHISGLAQRGAAPLANRDKAHASRPLTHVMLSRTTPRRREPCAKSRFAWGTAPLCACPLICQMGSVGSRQARSGVHVVGHNTPSPILLPSFFRVRFWANPQGGKKWCSGRPRRSQTALDGSLGSQSRVAARQHARVCSRARATIVHTDLDASVSFPRVSPLLGGKNRAHYRGSHAA